MHDLMQPIGTPDGLFHDGNPATGELGTLVSALWLNAVQGAARSVQAELLSVLAAAGIAVDPSKNTQVLDAIKKVSWGADSRPTTLNGYGITDGLRQFKSGEALPNKDIGPIWHADFNSLMTWQVFSANGANYTGYASVLVGSLLADTQPTPRAGYISSGSLSLSRTAYAALRGWAMHNGIMVASGVWAAGIIAVADNTDGTTFRAYDVRGEFPRFWDSGRGVDAGRAFGSWQGQAIQSHSHASGVTVGSGWNYPESSVATGGTGGSVPNTGSSGGAETRPRNVPLHSSIKF
ncbi:hypothetical protein [Laribacter hongkongensis]|uniref:hypothetical protein n=1 Tax=Laribacter hongkongensis TaxID=168471 RepID=UPI001EFD9752|nr:hypothetical protein [Laribacter hongkongensis]MCG8993203.1 hypothetical protein [Laribacter hongkongensis]MCG8997978.1 hypothetical protein [Laribacter hongkongensis]MCG9000356.1 hypothetical protein [Laribacter hongkongensis]MCG9005621.1 hypothetical protein [Laribacter hongkongensis]MCG9005945.1 hypothetical protein [Laribacter hongkongensis]